MNFRTMCIRAARWFPKKQKGPENHQTFGVSIGDPLATYPHDDLAGANGRFCRGDIRGRGKSFGYKRCKWRGYGAPFGRSRCPLDVAAGME